MPRYHKPSKPVMTTTESEVGLSVSGYWNPGEPERGPTYDCGGTPPVSPFWEDISVMMNGFELPMCDELREWAEGQLDAGRVDDGAMFPAWVNKNRRVG